MGEKGINKALVQKCKANCTGIYTFRKMFNEYLNLLHVSFYDQCCPNNSTLLPTGYDAEAEQLNYYDPVTKANVPLTNINLVARADVVESMEDFSTYDNSVTESIYISTGDRAGQFVRYTGSDAVDGGMIIADGGGNKWKRVLHDNKINVQWYGAKAIILSDPHDCLPDFQAARDYIYSHVAEVDTLYIPYDDRGLVEWSGGDSYFLSDTLHFDQGIKIEGDGILKEPRTRLMFELHTTGIVFNYPHGSSAFSAGIKNLRITSSYDGTFDITKHAITTNTFIEIDNVSIEQFDGNGLHISACAIAPNGDNNNFGNVNHSKVINLKVAGCTNGIFIEGCDANIIYFENIDVTGNRRWGSFDNGFLGNLYIQPHSGGNGNVVGGNSVVLYDGKYYAARPGFDDYFGDSGENVNKQPDISPLYWYEISAMGAVAWDDTTRYYSGGPFCVRNDNAWTQFVSPYTEGFQPPVYLNSRSQVRGGDNGAGVVGGSYHTVLLGADIFANADQIMPNTASTQHRVAIGPIETDASCVLKIVNDNSLSSSIYGIKSENTGIWSANTIINNLAVAEYGILNYTYYVTVPDAGFSIDAVNGLIPSNNGLLDLGIPASKWKTVNAVDAKFSGIPEYANRTAALSGGLTAGMFYSLPIAGDNKVICIV